MGVYMDAFGKVKNNLRERINAIPGLITEPIETVVEGIEEIVSLRPVKGITHIVEHTGDGVVHFVDKQADITRRWMGP
jgi:hypothetical protein